ncbi:MAG TPA: MFS transporter [Myxococcales bacterium]|nr:MFS transporter [Myxococcales bacterium]
MIGRLRFFYFLYYASVGTFLSYFALWLRGLGFSGEQIGAVTFAQQAVAAPSALVWGGIADRLGAPARALSLCTAGMLLATCGLPFARTPAQVGGVLVLSALFSGAVVPLVDSTTVETIRRAPGPSYARTRLWGSAGFILTAQGLGLLLAARGDRPGDRAMPLAYLGCVAGFTLLAQALPPMEAHPQRPHFRDILPLLRNPRLLFLLAICAAHWTACAPYHLLFGVLVRDLGLPSSVTGAALATGVAAELFALLAFPALLRRFSLRLLFASAFAGSALRWAVLSRVHGALPLVALQLLHALSFGFFWGCAVEGMQRIVPVHLRATGQALFSALVFFGGNALGYALSGAAYDRLGSAAPLYAGAAAVELLPLLLLLLPLSPEEPRA